MTRKLFVYPYTQHSASAKKLADALGARRIKREGSRFSPGGKKLVINWGSSELPDWNFELPVINQPQVVSQVTNKLDFFSMVSRTEAVGWLPNWSTSRHDAEEWMYNDCAVVCRTRLTGHSGEGIVIAHEPEELVEAPLYTIYKKKRQEFRVHIVQGQIFDIQRKARNRDVPDDEVDWKIRTHNRGFIYARDWEPERVPRRVKDAALSVFNASMLDFGAVDVIWNENNDNAWVLEINTSPGLEGTTLDNYVAALSGMIEEM